MSNFACFVYDHEEKIIKMKQNGVFRISCLDCLSRTTKFMQIIAAKIMEMQLRIVGIESKDLTIHELLMGNY